MASKKEVQEIFGQYTAGEMRKMILKSPSQKELAKRLGVSEYILRGYAASLGIVRKHGRPMKNYNFKETQQIIEDEQGKEQVN